MTIVRTVRLLVPVLCCAAALGACGGGGSSDSETAAAADGTASPAGTYTGSYACAATSGSDEVFTAVLPTATGAFSSCSGSVDTGTLAIQCSGSISATGVFVANGVDANGVASTATGTVAASGVDGTFTVPSKGITGNFHCNRS